MKAINFEASNVIYAKSQPEYLDLPTYRTKEGMVTSCYELTWKERFAILFGAKVWVSLLTFNRPLQPQRLVVSKEIPEEVL